jgi:RND family efflux transporter MFP subunit
MVTDLSRGADPVVLASARGITEPFRDVLLSAATAGIVQAKNFQEGDRVNQGDIIFALDKRLEELETNRRQLVVELRKTDADSTRILFSKTTGVAKDELAKKEVDHKVAAVEYDMAMEQLRRRQITAPFAGTLSDLLLEVGEAVQAYQPMARLVDTSQFYFVCNLEARMASRLTLNQAVSVEIETGTETFVTSGKITFLSPVVDPASGLMKVKALFDNSAGKIRPGLAGKITFK